HPFPRVDVPLTAKKKSALPIVLVIVLVLLVGGGVGGYFILKGMRQTPTDPGEVAVKANPVSITGGKFQMGRSDGPPSEVLAHPVTVGNFEMDKTEVTNLEYGQFVKQANHAPPEQWGSIKPPVGQESLPVS